MAGAGAAAAAGGAPVLWCGYAFVAWHAFGVLQSPDVVLGLREFYKIALGLLCLTVTVAFFPRDEKALANFWIVVIWSTTALLGFLVYQSVQLGAPYLVSEFGEVSRAAKNQLAGFMVYAFPFVVGYVSHKGRGWMRPLQAVPALVFSVALLYNGSRGGWVAATCSLLVVMAMSDPATRVRRIMVSLVVTGLAITGAYYTLEIVSPLEPRVLRAHRLLLRSRHVPRSIWNDRRPGPGCARIFASADHRRRLGSTGEAIGTRRTRLHRASATRRIGLLVPGDRFRPVRLVCVAGGGELPAAVGLAGRLSAARVL